MSGKTNLSSYQNYVIGTKGFDLLTSGTDTSGSWYAIQVYSGSALMEASCASGSNLPLSTITANTTIKS
jgi:hypothetical protein